MREPYYIADQPTHSLNLGKTAMDFKGGAIIVNDYLTFRAEPMPYGRIKSFSIVGGRKGRSI